MNRRSFLGAILAAGMAPAYVKASSLMPVVSRIWVPWGAYPYSISANGGIYIGPTARGLARVYNLMADAEIARLDRHLADTGLPWLSHCRDAKRAKVDFTLEQWRNIFSAA